MRSAGLQNSGFVTFLEALHSIIAKLRITVHSFPLSLWRLDHCYERLNSIIINTIRSICPFVLEEAVIS